jgi:hypothetical protein
MLYDEVCEWNLKNNNLQGDAIVLGGNPTKVTSKQNM